MSVNVLAKYEEPLPFKDRYVEKIYSACGVYDGWRWPGEDIGYTVYLLCEGEYEGDEIGWFVDPEWPELLLDVALIGCDIREFDDKMRWRLLGNGLRKHYWGMTGRALQVRLAEHVGCFDYQGRIRSGMAMAERMSRGLIRPQIVPLIHRQPAGWENWSKAPIPEWQADEDEWSAWCLPSATVVKSGLRKAAAKRLESELIEWSHLVAPEYGTNNDIAGYYWPPHIHP